MHYKATLTFKDVFDIEYVRVVERDEQDMFYAILAGTISGNLTSGSSLIAMDRTMSY